MLWLVIGFLVLGSSQGVPLPWEEGKLCRWGGVELPVEIFERYAGWKCYEETFTGKDPLEVRVCTVEHSSGKNYSVPCFKGQNGVVEFDLKNGETLKEMSERYNSLDLNNEMISCFFRMVNSCKNAAPVDLQVSRTWVPTPLREGERKFHIAMLSISMIIGIPAAIIFSYCAWTSQSELIGCCRNLVISLVFRTLFTILIETEIVSEWDNLYLQNWAGCEVIAAFEAIFANLVVSFWLLLTLYLFEYSRCEFAKNPKMLRMYCFVLGLAVVLALTWVTVSSAGGHEFCWLLRTPLQWVNDSLRIAYIIVQIPAIIYVVYNLIVNMHGTNNKDNLDFRKVSFITLLLTPLFLLQFSLNAGQPSMYERIPFEENNLLNWNPIQKLENEEPYLYSEYFFDGLQCAIVCLCYLFVGEVWDFLRDMIGLGRKSNFPKVLETRSNVESTISTGNMQTIKVVTTREAPEERRDVKYSSVLSQERFEKTIKLYNRMNVMKPEVERERKTSTYHDPDNWSDKSVYHEVENVQFGRSGPRYYQSKYLVTDIDEFDPDELKKTAEVQKPEIILDAAALQKRNKPKPLARTMLPDQIKAVKKPEIQMTTPPNEEAYDRELFGESEDQVSERNKTPRVQLNASPVYEEAERVPESEKSSISLPKPDMRINLGEQSRKTESNGIESPPGNRAKVDEGIMQQSLRVDRETRQEQPKEKWRGNAGISADFPIIYDDLKYRLDGSDLQTKKRKKRRKKSLVLNKPETKMEEEASIFRGLEAIKSCRTMADLRMIEDEVGAGTGKGRKTDQESSDEWDSIQVHTYSLKEPKDAP